jgi:hypothetical protein
VESWLWKCTMNLLSDRIRDDEEDGNDQHRTTQHIHLPSGIRTSSHFDCVANAIDIVNFAQ